MKFLVIFIEIIYKMFTLTWSGKISFLFFICLTNCLFAQAPYQFVLSKTTDECISANASLEIAGTAPADEISIRWSTGETGKKNIYDLKAGAYSVKVTIKHTKDTVVNATDTIVTHIKDTTIKFLIDKQRCVVSVPKYFSPNGDNYNDLLHIGNIGKYPDFELSIFDKWGQRVHHQRSQYMPWDGTWLGANLPDGTYFFVLFYEASDKNNLVKGDITILR